MKDENANSLSRYTDSWACYMIDHFKIVSYLISNSYPVYNVFVWIIPNVPTNIKKNNKIELTKQQNISLKGEGIYMRFR